MKSLVLLVFSLLFANIIFAQTPESFKYQAVVRDASGYVIASQPVGVQIGIVQGSQSGTVVYSETFAPTTNQYGLINLNIGEGTSSDIFEDINWVNGPYFIKLEVDVAGGTNYEDLGTSLLKSVPFALLAKDIQNKQILNVSNDTLYLTDGGQVYLGGYNNLWTAHDTTIFYNSGYVGVGTENPQGKLVVQGDTTSSDTLPLFEVKNKDGQTIFAVYDGGVRVYVNDDPAKANNDKSGFAIGGYRLDKSVSNEYLRISPDSIRMYIKEDDGTKANNDKGGFAIGGYRLDKTTPDNYFNIFSTDTLQTIDPSEPRILWYPLKEAFLAGRVLIESPDSVGVNSFATGFESKAIGAASQALGFHARSKGNNSIAIGNYANAVGDNSFAFGDSTVAIGYGSYAFGSTGIDSNTVPGTNIVRQTIARGSYSFAMGFGAYADSSASIAMGAVSSALGSHSVAIGLWDTTFVPLSYAIGIENKTYGLYSTAIGSLNETYGHGSFAIGSNNIANGNGATTFGTSCYANGDGAFAIGIQDTASANGALAMGYQNTASGAAATAFGYGTVASGPVATTFGSATIANGWNSIAFGNTTYAGGINSTVFGNNMTVNGNYSFGINLSTSASILTQANTMAITGGYVGIGTVAPTRALHVYTTATTTARFGRSNNGTIIEFGNSGIVAGSISVSGITVSYNAFTGSHYVDLKKETEVGMLLELNGKNDVLVNVSNGEIIYGTEVASTENSSNIIGSYFGKEDFNKEKSPKLAMAVGNGSMWVIDNGNDLQIGDYLISSSVKGHATIDNGKYDVAHIIARVAEPVNWKKETKEINGIKHKLVSVFFESFDLYHYDNKLNKQQNEIDILKKEIEELKQILEFKAGK